MKTYSLALVLALTTLGACAFDEVGDLPDDRLHTRLGTRATLSLEAPSLVGVLAYDRRGNELPCVQPEVAAGEIVARTTPDGLLLIEKLTIELSDVIVGAGVITPAPVQFTDIHLALGTQLVVEPSWSVDGLRAEGAGRADLVLDWAVLDGNEVIPLAPQKLDQIAFSVRARLTPEGTIQAEIGTAVEGPLWGFEIVTLADLALALHGATPQGAAP